MLHDRQCDADDVGSWKASVPTRVDPTCPVSATIGTESMYASVIGVTRFVAPAPRSPCRRGAAGDLRVALRHVPGALFVAGEEGPDIRFIRQGVEQRDHRTTGDAEYGVDPCSFESVQRCINGTHTWLLEVAIVSNGLAF